MAYNAQLINPIDFRPGVALGVTLPFNGPAVFNSSYTTEQAIKSNIINWFLTNKGERPLNPDYGSNLSQFIFEQITQDNLDSLKTSVQSQINQQFPEVIVRELNVLSNPDLNSITVEIYYQVINTTISGNITINF
jgi:phage baseplate assembly protein W